MHLVRAKATTTTTGPVVVVVELAQLVLSQQLTELLTQISLWDQLPSHAVERVVRVRQFPGSQPMLQQPSV